MQRLADPTSVFFESANATRAIPPILSFTYKFDLLHAPEDKLSARERTLAANVRSTIRHHQSFEGQATVHFYDDSKCVDIIKLAFPRLLPFFLHEVSGMYKGDICRGAALFHHGGLYFDVDMVARMNSAALIRRRTQFVTCISNADRVKTLKWDVTFFQSFIAVAPRHKIIERYLEALLQTYQSAVDSFGSMATFFKPQVANKRSHVMGTIAMRRGYESWLHDGGMGGCGDASNASRAKRQQLVQLWEETPISSLPEANRVPRQPFAKHTRRCELVVMDPASGHAPFYSRLPGTDLCPFNTNFLRLNKSARTPPPGRHLSSEDGTTSTGRYLSSNERATQPPHVLLIGLARDLTAIAPHAVRTIVHHWCSSGRLIHEVHFIVGKLLPPDKTIGTIAGLGSGEHCDVTIKLQPASLGESRRGGTNGESPSALVSRVERIAAIREWQRRKLRGRLAELSARDAWVVLVDVDSDIRSLPYAGALEKTLAKAQAGKWSLLCANGVEPSLTQDRLTTYDTFPLVGTDGFWFYKDREAGRRQFDQITWAGDAYPVNSCFGGMAIYPFRTWMEDRCSYNMTIGELHAQGWLRFSNAQDTSKLLSQLRQESLCEHLRLHLCLKAMRPEWRAGIEPQLMLVRAHSRAAGLQKRRRSRPHG